MEKICFFTSISRSLIFCTKLPLFGENWNSRIKVTECSLGPAAKILNGGMSARTAVHVRMFARSERYGAGVSRRAGRGIARACICPHVLVCYLCVCDAIVGAPVSAASAESSLLDNFREFTRAWLCLRPLVSPMFSLYVFRSGEIQDEDLVLIVQVRQPSRMHSHYTQNKRTRMCRRACRR